MTYYSEEHIMFEIKKAMSKAVLTGSPVVIGYDILDQLLRIKSELKHELDIYQREED